MYLSIEQLKDSLHVLDEVHPFFGTSFLVFKGLELPITKSRYVDIANQEKLLLNKYYNPLAESKFYYVPLRGGSGRKDRWVSKSKYPTSTLQKMRTSTLSHVFIHSTSSTWAWHSDYVSLLAAFLQQQGRGRVPVFHLAVWLFRDLEWPTGTTRSTIIEDFFVAFNISSEERSALFDTSLNEFIPVDPLLQEDPITWKELRQLIDIPGDALPDEGGGLSNLELINVGPAKHIELDLAPRLDIISGDNGLGKTFLLDCAWWALTGQWADLDQPAYVSPKSTGSSIGFRISGSNPYPKLVHFDKVNQKWPAPDNRRPVLPGLVIYARVDGSCVIWDPAKHYWQGENERTRGLETSDAIRLSQNEVWDGLDIKKSGRTQVICNGLIRDWVTWQYRPRMGAFSAFSRVLENLSPHPREFSLIPSEPTKLSNDDREIPTLKMPYGDVPVVLLSAGIKRILSLAYLLVWTWEGHKSASRDVGRPVQSKIVFLIDEMEAHLHPQWQRIIVPALLKVIKVLENQLDLQLFIATHSPLIMASVEAIFNEDTDKLFTLDLAENQVEAREIQYQKHGSVNAWLTSEVFELKRPYSVEAENALIDAKNLQLSNEPNPEEIKDISSRLATYLPEMDPFWPRWKYFAERNGVNV